MQFMEARVVYRISVSTWCGRHGLNPNASARYSGSSCLACLESGFKYQTSGVCTIKLYMQVKKPLYMVEIHDRGSFPRHCISSLIYCTMLYAGLKLAVAEGGDYWLGNIVATITSSYATPQCGHCRIIADSRYYFVRFQCAVTTRQSTQNMKNSQLQE